MHAIVTVESAKRPFAIGYALRDKDGKPFRLVNQPKNKTEAVEWAKWFLSAGYRFDAGVAQVSSANFARFGLTPETVFDECPNVRAGATILQECYTKALTVSSNDQHALQRALSCYQSGNFSTGFKTGYVKYVTDKGLTYESQSRARVSISPPGATNYTTSIRPAGDRNALPGVSPQGQVTNP